MKNQLKLMVVFCLLTIGAVGFIAFNLGSLHALDNQIIHGAGNTFYSDYKGQTSTYHYEGNAVTVESVVNLMSEPWQQLVILQGNHVAYKGTPDNVNSELSQEKVIEIANTEDSVNNDSITLIIE